jgi:hypothetical protein
VKGEEKEGKEGRRMKKKETGGTKREKEREE